MSNDQLDQVAVQPVADASKPAVTAEVAEAAKKQEAAEVTVEAAPAQ